MDWLFARLTCMALPLPLPPTDTSRSACLPACLPRHPTTHTAAASPTCPALEEMPSPATDPPSPPRSSAGDQHGSGSAWADSSDASSAWAGSSEASSGALTASPRPGPSTSSPFWFVVAARPHSPQGPLGFAARASLSAAELLAPSLRAGHLLGAATSSDGSIERPQVGGGGAGTSAHSGDPGLCG